MRQFRANMRDYVVNVQSDHAVVPADLSPPDFLQDSLQTLGTLAKSYDTSVAATNDNGEGFQTVLAEALDPFMSGCEDLQKGMKEPDSAIFAINCLFVAKEVLSPYPFAQARVTELDEVIEEHVMALTEYQHQYLLHDSGLNTLLEALSGITESEESIRSIPELGPFKPDALVAASQQLDEFLPSALIDASEKLKHLRNREMIQKITEEAANKFCEDFELVEARMVASDDLTYEEDKEDEEQEPGLRDLFPRTSGEIRVLLS